MAESQQTQDYADKPSALEYETDKAKSFVGGKLADFMSGKNIGAPQIPPTPSQSGLPLASPKQNVESLPLAQAQNNPPLPTPDLARGRADKASWALEGHTVLSTDELSNAIMSGQENNVRQLTSLEDSQIRTADVLSLPTYDQQQLLRAMTPVSNEYFWEDRYAHRIVDNIINGDMRNVADQYAIIRMTSPELVDIMANAMQATLTKTSWLQKKLEDVNHYIENKPKSTYGWSILKDIFVPGQAGLTGNIMGLIAPGSEMAQQAYDMWAQSPENFVSLNEKRIKELMAHDPLQARDYIEWMLDHGQDKVVLNNLLNFGDWALRAALPGPVLKTLYRTGAAAGAEGLAHTAVVSSIRNAGRPAEVVADLAAGDTVGAGVKNASRVLYRRLVPNHVETPEPILDRIVSALKTPLESKLTDAPNLLSEAERRAYNTSVRVLSDFITRSKNMMRINPAEKLLRNPRVVQSLYEEAVERGEFSGVSNRILDYDLGYDAGTNTYYWKLYLGHYDASLFKSPQQAQTAMGYEKFMTSGKIREQTFTRNVKMEGLTGVTKQQGRGYYVELQHPLRQDTPLMNMYLEAGKGNDMPDGWVRKWGSVFAKAIGPENTMSFNDIMERRAVMYMPNYLMQTILDSVKDVQSLGGIGKKQLMRDWKRVVNQTRNRINPANGKPGHWFESAGELNTEYQSLLHRAPTDLETGAYFALKNAFDLDWVARNSRVYTMLANAGFKKVTIEALASGASWMNDRRFVTSPAFHARRIPELPGNPDATIGLFGPNIDDMDILPGRKISSKKRQEIADLVKEEQLAVYELHDFWNTPLSGFGLAKDKHMIHYVVGKNFTEVPIDAIQVPYTGAGHLIPKAKYYFKQPHMREDSINRLFHYTGDTTFAAVPKHAEGKAFEKHLDEMQRLTREGKDAELQQYHLTHGIPFSLEDWYKATKGFKDQHGKFQQPYINLRDPIRVIPESQSYLDSIHGNALKQRYGDSFRDINKGTSRRHLVPFTQERDMQELRELRNEGSVNNPIWKFEHAELLDPFASLERGVNSIIRSHWMDDHKINTVKRWLSDVISHSHFQGNEAEIRNAPLYYFFHPDELYSKTMSLNDKSFYESNRWKIKQFTSIGSRNETITHNYMQKLVDGLYESGHKWASDRLIGMWEWGQDHEPMRLLRSMVFHKSLGLFSLPIMTLHAMTGTNGAMILGLNHTMKATTGAMLHMWASYNRNPAFLNTLDRVAVAMGWKPGAWLRANHLTTQVPFLQEPGTFALHEEALSSRLIPTMWGKFLNAGLGPFNIGLKGMRSFSWYGAMSEFTHGGGGTFKWTGHLGAMTDEHINQVLARADLLAHNMTRASANYLNTGWRSTALQFMTYHDRLINMALGKQLTTWEKLKFFAGNFALYGIGGPMSLYSLGLGDLLVDWNQTALRNGYNPGKNGISDFFLRGLPSMFLAYYMPGKSDGSQYWFNFADRFGPKGYLHEFTGYGKDQSQSIASSLVTMLGGPLESTMNDVITAFHPFWRAVMSMLPGGSEDGPRWQITSGHVMSAFRRISSINNMYTAYYAARFGKWFTRDGGLPVETDIPTYAAMLQFATGLRSQQQVDMYALQKQIGDDKKAGDSIMLEMRNLMERASEAAEQGNLDEADTLNEDAWALSKGLTYSELEEVPRMIRSDSQIKATFNKYYNPKRVTPDKQKDLMEQGIQHGAF